MDRIRGGGGPLVWSDADGARGLQPAVDQSLYGAVRGDPGRDLHHPRSAALRDEHEPGADAGLVAVRACVARRVDLFSGATPRDAARSASVPRVTRPWQR